VNDNGKHLGLKCVVGSSIHSLITDTVYDALEMLALFRPKGNFQISTTNTTMCPTIFIPLPNPFSFHSCTKLQLLNLFLSQPFLSMPKIHKPKHTKGK